MSKIAMALERAAQLRDVKGSGQPRTASAAVALLPNDGVRPPARQTERTAGLAPEPTELARSMESIAHMREKTLLTTSEREQYRLIAPESVPGSPLEAFRHLRTEILRRLHARNAVIMVSSVCVRGGASFVAANLAAAFALDAARTALLIDGNLRQPAFTRLVKQRPCLGLVDYLENPSLSAEAILHPIGVERLRVIPAGERVRESSREYYSSARMLELIQELRDRYPERMIIFDAPPMTESADTRILSALCDAVLLVVPYARVRAAILNDCLREIGAERVVGVVFNDAPPPASFFWKELVASQFVRWRERLRKPARGH